jgi:hypothetical protein
LPCNCSSCDPTTGVCTACPPGYGIGTQNCAQCNNVSYSSGNQPCSPCGLGCATCDTTSGNCITCKPVYGFSNPGTCSPCFPIDNWSPGGTSPCLPCNCPSCDPGTGACHCSAG